MAAMALAALLVTHPAGAQGPPAPASPATTSSGIRAGVQRWFDLQALSLSARYQRVVNSAGVVTADHMQDQVQIRGRLKFDRAGRYALNAGWGTGSTFNAGWNNAGWGTGGPRNTGLHLKQFFLSAAPVKGIDFSYGSLAFVRGESTEITTFDNDGYVTGARVSVKRPATLHVDELAVTEGYIGDLAEPGFTDRASRLADFNYAQVLVERKVGAGAWSAGYTHWQGDTLRAAVSVKIPEARVVDYVRYEQYGRLNHDAAYGFAAYAEKAVVKRVVVNGGYADIDEHYGGLNSDRFNRGRRFFAGVTVQVLRDLTASLFDTHAVHNDFSVPLQHRFDAVVTYNALGPLRRAGIFR